MSGQDWLDKDFYAVLGVSKDASAQEIKKAYRTKARKYHPDRHPDDPKAEETFKEIGEAYSVLNDPEQREQYDAIRAMGSGGARFSAGQGGPGGAGFEDIFSSMFGGGGPAGFQAAPSKGQDVSARTRLPFRDAALGTEVRLTVDGKAVTARIPAGVYDGQKIRLRGKGRPGPGGAPAGDLLLTLEVEEHPVWSADGANLRITVPVSFDEAVLGTTLSVPLLDGGTVSVKIPAGTPSGRTLRVRGKGLVTKKTTGDLHVTVEVAVPTHVEGAAKKAVEDLRDALADEDPRAGLAAAAAG
jgi:molecular chaperone DnaJ